MTQRVARRNVGVPREYALSAEPFGATTKMDGCDAIYPAIVAIFVARFFGIELSIEYRLIALVSIVGAAATVGSTGATVMHTLTLSALGLPREGVSLLLAVDSMLDKGCTALNVAGEALVAKREGILDLDL